MARDWVFLRVTDIAERVASGPFGSNIKSDDYLEDGVPVIRGINLAGPRFICGGNLIMSELFEGNG